MLNQKDTVQLRITVRKGDNTSSLTIDELIPINELHLDNFDNEVDIPKFDLETYSKLMATGKKEDVEEALRMNADFNNATADYVARMEQRGQGTTLESLSRAITDWVIKTRPRGHLFTENRQDEAYVISPSEMNISKIARPDGGFAYFASAVGTWGKP